MKKKKGFTLVELVIVIAVIAILSAILIPTFGSIMSDAKETSAKADLKSAITTYLAENSASDTADINLSDNCFIKSDDELTAAPTGKAYLYNNGEITKITLGTSADADGKASLPDGETKPVELGSGWYMFDYTSNPTD